MAINKKLIHFNKKEDFNKLSKATSATDTNVDILWSSIVFIKDTKEIWTHGQIYPSDSYTQTEIDEKLNILSSDLESHESDNIKHVPSGGSEGQVLTLDENGNVIWSEIENNETICEIIVNFGENNKSEFIPGFIKDAGLTTAQLIAMRNAITNKQTINLQIRWILDGTDYSSSYFIPYTQWSYDSVSTIYRCHIKDYFTGYMLLPYELEVMIHYDSVADAWDGGLTILRLPFGESTDFVKGDGSLDSNTYLTSDALQPYVTFDSIKPVEKNTVTVTINATDYDSAIEEYLVNFSSAQYDLVYNAIQNYQPVTLKITADDSTDICSLILDPSQWVQNHFMISDSDDYYMYSLPNDGTLYPLVDSSSIIVSILKQENQSSGGLVFIKGIPKRQYNGSSSQFVKGDGSFDDTKYLSESDLSAKLLPNTTVAITFDSTSQEDQTIDLSNDQASTIYNKITSQLPIKLTIQDTSLTDYSPSEINIDALSWTKTETTSETIYVANLELSDVIAYNSRIGSGYVFISHTSSETTGKVVLIPNNWQTKTLSIDNFNDVTTPGSYRITTTSADNQPDASQGQLLVLNHQEPVQIYIAALNKGIFYRKKASNIIWTVWSNLLKPSSLQFSTAGNDLNNYKNSNFQIYSGNNSVANVPSLCTSSFTVHVESYNWGTKQTITCDNGITFCRCYINSAWTEWECVYIPESQIPVITIDISSVNQSTIAIKFSDENFTTLHNALLARIPVVFDLQYNGSSEAKFRVNYDMWEFANGGEVQMLSRTAPYAISPTGQIMMHIIALSTEANLMFLIQS